MWEGGVWGVREGTAAGPPNLSNPAKQKIKSPKNQTSTMGREKESMPIGEGAAPSKESSKKRVLF